MSLTPFRSTVYKPPAGRDDWPPAIEQDRLDRYLAYEALIENTPWDVFASLRLSPEQMTKVVLAVALPELLCNVWADALYGSEDPPDVSFADDSTSDRWDQIWKANGGDDVLGWEGIFGTAFRGVGVWKLRRARDDEPRTEQIVIEEIVPSIYFPKLRRDGRTLESVTLAYEEDRAEPGSDKTDVWQRKEEHFLDVNGQYVIRYLTRPAKDARGGWIEWLPEERPDGVDFLPFVDMHAKRWSGRYWGMSELERNLTLFDEIDDRLSAIGEILDYHGSPILQVPKSTLFGGVFYKGADRTIGVANADEANIARYVTYDAQAQSQFSAVEKAIELAFLTSEVPPTYFGMLEGAVYSGSALRLRLQNYLKKAARYQRKDEARLHALIHHALRLDGFGEGDELVPETIEYGDPLPADDLENSQIESSLFAGRLSSQETSIRRLRRVQDVGEEISRIEADQEKAGAQAQGRANVEPPAGLGELAPGSNTPTAG
jgi:SPP1 Gp6-like portal protein